MKVFLDDERVAPAGWVQVIHPTNAIRYLKEGGVTHISLDHDLGIDDHTTGYEVLLWIEEEVWKNIDFIPPVIIVHTSNPPARKRMLQSVNAIWKCVCKRERMRNE